ncbi:transglutaminase TgpA family protein [Alkalicoccus urumqiensis]|uniref:Peptidase n=1 Tax=Alkalicoccus urumqiensis TaxID=1548213 RepID=A0A2P6MJ11_ALKUR|nr:transglutaminaseTgpA domain-containing protein [Alkalicoccus urumqiensis]PRO66262.1 peptidase [Alkalicoccus urumqiensis]
MNVKQRTPAASLTHLIIYLLAFLLLWEWLRPIPVITSTGQIGIFVLFTFAASICVYLHLPVWAGIPLLFAGSMYSLHQLFYAESFFSAAGFMETLRRFTNEIGVNTAMIAGGNFAGLTDYFRSFLLLLLLALISYLLYYWILHTRRVFFFLFCTIVYITVLDTFTLVDASQAVVRIVVIGFFLLTLLHMLRVQDEDRRTSGRTVFSPAWMYTLLVMVTIAVAVAWAAPKPEPQWADPVPAFRSFAGLESSGGGGGTVQRIGYGENDEQLGGGFVQDDGPVLEAVVDEPGYWRGESKDIYTGSGWEAERDYVPAETVNEGGEEAVDFRLFNESASGGRGTAEITMAEETDFNLLFYQGSLVDVPEASAADDAADWGREDLQFYTDVIGGRTVVESPEGESVRLTDYRFEYDTPAYPEDVLRNAGAEDPESVTDRYLQLPDDLPERVVELAEEITAETDNRYDAAKEIEQYFSANGFEYETSDVPVPEEGEDYVDQFLFETQVGYCDNYSTSMAVMLRALDIPTRWVKGFTAGEEVDQTDDGRSVYEVRNSNAHSWVEVYFPEVGWVTFEPTQGFTNYAEFESETETPDVDTDSPDIEPEMPDVPEGDDVNDQLQEGTEEESEDGLFGSGSGSGGGMTPWQLFLISIPPVLLLIYLYRSQKRLQITWYLTAYQRGWLKPTFSQGYRRLEWMLQKEGLQRRNGETIREFGERVDRELHTSAMKDLSAAYEKEVYGGSREGVSWSTYQTQWEKIIRSLLA